MEFLCGSIAFAQPEGALEEIVVTARKRPENLQEVSAAVSALTPTDLSKRFDTDLQGFANAAPNVIIDDLQQGPGSPAAIAIRGVGTTDVEKSFDPAAGVVLDGIFIGANSGAMIKALDVQSVEMLRGPQGTLFGRNSIAGVINVTRTKPSDTLTGKIRVGYGNYNDVQVDGYVSGPITDSLSVKLAAGVHNRDGYFYDRTLGRSVGAQDFKALSPSLHWKLSDALSFDYRLDKTWQKQDPDVLQNMAQPNQAFCAAPQYAQCAQSVTSPQSGDRYVVLQNGVPAGSGSAYFNTELHTFNAHWEIAPGYRVEYLFGYFKTDEAVHQDWDATPLSLYDTDRPARYYQHSHELRLSSTGDGPVTYTVGLYDWNSGYRIDLTNYIGFYNLFVPAVPPDFVVVGHQTVEQRTDSSAAFFEGDWKFAPDWTLTVGGRYTHDKKTSGLIDVSITDPATASSLSNLGSPFEKSWSQFTPKASLRYKITPDASVYALFSRGFRAGGFDGRPNTYDAASQPYDPEKMDNFELGLKSEWFERKLRLNVAAFYMKYTDKQEEESVLCGASCSTGQETLIINASSADITGMEVDLAAHPYKGLSVTATLGLLHAKYKKLVDPVDPNPATNDLSNLHLRRAPSVTATLSPEYEWPVAGGMASVRADWHFIGSEELTFFNSPQSRNPAQHIVDPSISYVRGGTRLSAYANNVTNTSSWATAYDVGATHSFGGLWTYTAVRAPRTYGVRISHDF
jgi:iron complex outermembrane receptor protein